MDLDSYPEKGRNQGLVDQDGVTWGKCKKRQDNEGYSRSVETSEDKGSYENDAAHDVTQQRYYHKRLRRTDEIWNSKM